MTKEIVRQEEVEGKSMYWPYTSLATTESYKEKQLVILRRSK